jgi:recombination protein RecA
VRIDVRRIGMLKDGDQVIWTRVRGKVVKNKVAPPFRQAEFDILFEGGISREADLLDLAVDSGVAARSGTWYSFGQMRLGQGRENARQFLRDNPDVFAEIREKVLEARRPKSEENAAVADQPRSMSEEAVKQAAPAVSNRRAPRAAAAGTSRKR